MLRFYFNWFRFLGKDNFLSDMNSVLQTPSSQNYEVSKKKQTGAKSDGAKALSAYAAQDVHFMDKYLFIYTFIIVITFARSFIFIFQCFF